MDHFLTLIARGITLLLLAACGAQPAPVMMGAKRFAVHVDGRDYVLFLHGNQVEVIRLGWAGRGSHQAIRATMIDLVPRLTGCHLVPSTVQGDSGEMRGRVTCSTARR
ncbi:hypothetical protein [Gemmobacter serpentinus]|uniref:hypothetical protein n=1 Tax=Gemmobacter serpentinus TaxID=2652247 RepID=UPI00124C71D1|nr:hypothetical protein [Gemmobacter serpentinus]